MVDATDEQKTLAVGAASSAASAIDALLIFAREGAGIRDRFGDTEDQVYAAIVEHLEGWAP